MPTYPLTFGSTHAPSVPIFDAAPTDADFAETPPDGVVVYFGGDLYVRAGGVWVNTDL